MIIRDFVRTFFSYLLFALVCWLFLIPVLAYLIIPEKWRSNSRFLGQATRFFYWIVLKCTLLPIIYRGRKYIPSEPVIFVANHQSALDVPLVGLLAYGQPHVWLAKQELTDSFFLRYLLPRASILVDTRTHLSAVRSLLQALKRVETTKQHIMIFPEGGRFTDGTIHEFFSGFVLLAKESKRPVIPVFIKGAAQAYPPGSFIVHYCSITVTVGEPIVFTDQTEDDFKKRVHNWFIQQNEYKE